MSDFKIGDEVVTLAKPTEVRVIVDKSVYNGDLYRLDDSTTWHRGNLLLVNRPADLYPGEVVAEIDEKTGQITMVPAPKDSKYTTDEYLAFVKKTLDDMQELIKQKNADYTNGAGPFANFEQASEFGVDPFQGLMLRMGDKMQRIKSYCKQGNLQVKGEGVEDCFKDFIGYSLIALAMLNQKKGKK